MEAVVLSIVSLGMAKRYLGEGEPFMPDGAIMVVAAAAAVHFFRAACHKSCAVTSGGGS